MNLYALLIGINEYESRPLQQCVKDVSAFDTYLLTLHNYYGAIHIQKLLDQKATKTTITHTINTFLTQATDDDVVLLYYSGHGALENSSGRFSDAHSGTIECIVCHHQGPDTNYLLADKEIRYLFSKFESSPHIVTVFDCCHSGDMVRSFDKINTTEDERQRKLSEIFDARRYTDFIFSNDIKESQLKSQKVVSLLPYKNTIHIAACLASESSWEDANGGVFTRYLLQILHANSNHLSYLDITKWAKISLRDVTHKRQTPTISVQGNGMLNQYSTWLNLYPEKKNRNSGYIYFNSKNGWYYNRGKLFGIQEGTEIDILIDVPNNKRITTKVLEVQLENSRIQDPIELGVLLDFDKKYTVTTNTVYQTLKIYINDLDTDIYGYNYIKKILTGQDNVVLCNKNEASFFVTLFNQTVYISLPDDMYRPLTAQIDILNTKEDYVGKQLLLQMNSLIKWNFYNTLENPETSFSNCPIKVEIKIDSSLEWLDITETSCKITTLQKQLTNTNEYFQKYQIRVSNVSNSALFVTALVLSSDFSISSDSLDNLSKLLKNNESVVFYEHRNTPFVGWSLDTYKEIYNWKNDWLHYKFIVTTKEDITTSIPDMNQGSLQGPITHLGNQMGHGAITDFLPSKAQWGIYSSTLLLTNPAYNTIGKKMQNHWEYYSTNEIVAPFINKLYANQQTKGFTLETITNTLNVSEDPTTYAKNLTNLKIIFGNHLDDKRRYRRFKKSKKLFPELPVIVAEGDSWFLFPFLVKDTLDYVMEKYPLRSIAAAGDELQNYRASGQLIETIKKEKPKYVLISGGGNDIIGPAIVDILKKDMPSGLEPMAYLNSTFSKKMEDIKATYNYFFNRISSFDSVHQVFVHGYDYVRVDHTKRVIKNGWVNKYLIQKGVEKIEDRARIIKYLIDQFNALLEALTSQHKNATYLDLRSLVTKEEWYDEIHPDDNGFAKVGAKFLEAINQLEYIGHENMQK
ncbi:caspase family protein [Aquimarina pacifica]|uniref:caspase family protein n=1 Tax=Aquimarina pacifica TaxID=1296415 RepID=UPI000472E085|nr:caspase family protein [Aquimarina pacifica]